MDSKEREIESAINQVAVTEESKEIKTAGVDPQKLEKRVSSLEDSVKDIYAILKYK